MEFKEKQVVTYNRGNYGAKDYRARVIGFEGNKIVLHVFYPGKAVPSVEYATEKQVKA